MATKAEAIYDALKNVEQWCGAVVIEEVGPGGVGYDYTAIAPAMLKFCEDYTVILDIQDISDVSGPVSPETEDDYECLVQMVMGQ